MKISTSLHHGCRSTCYFPPPRTRSAVSNAARESPTSRRGAKHEASLLIRKIFGDGTRYERFCRETWRQPAASVATAHERLFLLRAQRSSPNAHDHERPSKISAIRASYFAKHMRLRKISAVRLFIMTEYCYCCPSRHTTPRQARETPIMPASASNITAPSCHAHYLFSWQ